MASLEIVAVVLGAMDADYSGRGGGVAVKSLEARSVSGLMKLAKETDKRIFAMRKEYETIEQELNKRGWYHSWDYEKHRYGWWPHPPESYDEYRKRRNEEYQKRVAESRGEPTHDTN